MDSNQHMLKIISMVNNKIIATI